MTTTTIDTSAVPAPAEPDEVVEPRSYASGDPAGYELDGIPQAVIDRIGTLDVDTASGCG